MAVDAWGSCALPMSEPEDQKFPGITKAEQGLARLISDPSLTVTEIAAQVGCERSTLYRHEKFRATYDTLQDIRREEKRNFPQGKRAKDGTIIELPGPHGDDERVGVP